MLKIVDTYTDEIYHDVADASDGLLLPVPGQHRDSIRLERRDGTHIQTLEAVGLALVYRGEEVFRLNNIHAALYLTDARIALACSHFDRGGGWLGDPVTMGVFNAASKLRAALRSHGKMLVGQARYPWIARVGSTSRLGHGTGERLIVEASEAATDIYRLIVDLPRHVSSAHIAAEVVRRAATYRLAAEADLTTDERRDFIVLQGAQPIGVNPSHGKHYIYFHEMPTCWYITERSARFAPPNREGC